MSAPASRGRLAFVIDDLPLCREGTKLFVTSAGFAIAGEAGSIADAVGQRDTIAPPDLILLAWRAEQFDAAEAIAALIAAYPAARVVVQADPAVDPSSPAKAFMAGVHGFLLLDTPPERAKRYFELVMLGEHVFPASLAVAATQRRRANGRGERNAVETEEISERQREILRWLCQGSSNSSIARRLGVTEATVKVNLKTILRKIGAVNRTQAAVWAANKGLLDGPP